MEYMKKQIEYFAEFSNTLCYLYFKKSNNQK